MNHLHCDIFLRDDDYLREIRAGGPRAETAISCLYLRYRKRTYTYIHRLIAKNDEFKGVPEDLVHDAFIIMLEKIRNGSESVHSLGGFWIGIGRNLFLNQLKKDQRIILVEDVYERYGTEDTSREWILQEEEENDQMERAFSRLGEKCREILLLWINRYTMIEIAQHMNLANDNMARKIKYECFKKLKEIVKTGHISHG